MGGGKCKSFKQEKPDVQETNGDKCSLVDAASLKYEGNCIPSSNSYYLIDSTKKIIDTSSAGTIGSLGSKDGSNQYTMTMYNTANIKENYYYLNADVFTKETYPLIKCDTASSCKLTKVDDAVGYYLNVPADSAASAIKCTKESCEIYSETITCSQSNIGKVNLTNKKFCNGDGDGADLNTIGEYLITVSGDNFPSITTKSNIAVKVDKTNGNKITLVKKNSSCSYDNEIIKKEDGKFYYCTFNTELEMKDDGAKFVNKKGSNYQLVQIKAIGPEILTASQNSKYYY